MADAPVDALLTRTRYVWFASSRTPPPKGYVLWFCGTLASSTHEGVSHAMLPIRPPVVAPSATTAAAAAFLVRRTLRLLDTTQVYGLPSAAVGSEGCVDDGRRGCGGENTVALPAGTVGIVQVFNWLYGLARTADPSYFGIQIRRTSGAGNAWSYGADYLALIGGTAVGANATGL